MKFKTAHFSRYREIVSLLLKYGRSDLARQIAQDEEFGDREEGEGVLGGNGTEDARAPSPEHLADDLEAMGPTYIKLGQVLAGRPDLFPEKYLTALSRLQDRVKPFPFKDVEQTVMEELGVRISKGFSFFDENPLAAASLGQVHRAALRDGRRVVVKVQRPGIRRQIAEDFEVLEQIAGFIDDHTELGRKKRFRVTLEEFRLVIRQELDYEREAHNLVTIGNNLKEFSLIQVPKPIPDFCTRRVLTMEEVQGQKITSLSPLALMELDGTALAEELFKAYLQQVLLDGLFHADPHPGNVFVTNDGRIALIDLGMVGHTAPTMQENLLKILLAVSEGNGEAAADLAIRMSQKLPDFNAPDFRHRITQLVASQRDRGLEQLNVGRSLLEVSGIAQSNSLIVPSELVLLAKTMLQLDEVGRILDPKFDASGSVRRNSTELLSRRMKKELTQGSIYSSLLEVKEFTAGLPTRLNRIIDTITNSELELKVTSADAKVVMDGMQKIANRITTGLVLASLIIGASLLMRVPTRFTLFGFPGLAILCFLAAAGGAVWLLISIILSDYKSEKRYRR
ncbi:MAG: AarF/UbiB family protein [Nibricoccus sp.]